MTLLLLLVPLFAQTSSLLKRGAIPSWVHPIQFDTTLIKNENKLGGEFFLLVDEQVDTKSEKTFVHRAIKVLNNSGVQDQSKFSLTINPAFEKVIFHNFRIHRKGKVLNRLNLKAFQLLQRETSMDRHIYDGRKTALLNLKDVRVGDIIEYSYTIVGKTPLLKGYISEFFTQEYGVPIGEQYLRLRHPKSENVEIKATDSTWTPSVDTVGNYVNILWKEREVAPVIADNDIPDWYIAYDFSMISSFKGWKGVVDWALPFYNIDAKTEQALWKQIPDSIQQKSGDEQALALIRFVQDEVRYLGLEIGINAYKPHNPMEVLEQRFGDCKDKSLLLCVLLKKCGINAYPLLVHSTGTRAVERYLPTPHAFNHCVVMIEKEGKKIFVDPTIDNQGGTLHTIAFPHYVWGLPIKEGVNDLIEIPFTSESSKTIYEDFDLGHPGEEQILKVKKVYTGSKADYVRYYLKCLNKDRWDKKNINYLSRIYNDIKIKESARYVDDRDRNRLTVYESYTIPGFWQESSSDDSLFWGEFFALPIKSYTNITNSSVRKMPYYLQYPLHTKIVTTVNHKTGFYYDPDSAYITNDLYHYKSKYYSPSKTKLIIEYEYKTKNDHVPIEAFDDYVVDNEDIRKDLSFTFDSENRRYEAKVGWMSVLVALIALACSAGISFVLYRFYNPHKYANHDLPHAPIRGFMIVPLLFLYGYMFYSLYALFADKLFDPTITSDLFSSGTGGEAFFYLLATFVRVILWVFTVLLIVLSVKRRTSFPILALVYMGMLFFWDLFYHTIARELEFTYVKSVSFQIVLMRGMFMFVIGSVYFLASQKTRSTYCYLHRKAKIPQWRKRLQEMEEEKYQQ